MTSLAHRLDSVLSDLPTRFPGPGGAVAVLRDGAVLERRAWGFADAERRIAFTPKTLFRICSITKQFVCALMLDLHPDPSVLDAEIRARLAGLEGEPPGALHLAHNQSGLRDYWAVAMLHGAPAESPFGEEDARAVIGATRSLQFAPGTRFSYSNGNFRLLGDAVAARAGRSLAELLRERIFASAGLETAFLAADTQAMPDGTEGYEGTQETGFRPAVNRILWTGDAGIGASLDDMIAWERHIDATRDDEPSLYRRLSAPVLFADGAPAQYGFGLARSTEHGRAVTGHGGALRGWRSHRLHVASERLSVVVMFNHLSDARAAALDVLGAALGVEGAASVSSRVAPDWLGAYLDPETELAARVVEGGTGRVDLRFVRAPELLDLRADGSAGGGDGTRLRPVDGALWMDRPGDNASTRLRPLEAGPGAGGLDGRYRCAELDADLTIADAGGALYGGFSGRLGSGRMELLERIGPDVLALPCPRALDHTPPGDWTLLFRRDAEVRERVQEIAESIFLADALGREAAFLSHGQKQWLEIGMLLIQDPALMMLDEPVAGMSVSERHKTAELLNRIIQHRSVLVIEHDMGFVEDIAHKVTVLHQGRIISEGSMAHVKADPRVVEVYLGH